MDLLLRAPALTAAEAVDLARRVYGIDAAASPLPSERDQNFLLQTAVVNRFVLKIANSTEDPALLDAQNSALAHVARRSALCPRPVPALDGSLLTEVTVASGARHYIRVLTWIEGEPLATRYPLSPVMLEQFGEKVGELDAALDGFDHPAIHRDFYWDLAGGFALVRDLAPGIEDESLRTLVMRLAAAIEARDGERLAHIRRGPAHNDPNDYNVIVAEAIAAILDFGDIVHTYAIAD